MSKRLENLRSKLYILVLIQLVVIVIFQVFITDYLSIVQYIALLIDVVLIFVVLFNAVKSGRERVVEVAELLGEEAQSAFEYGKISVITLDQANIITWISENFDEAVIGSRIDEVFPDLIPLVSGKEEKVRLIMKNHNYEATMAESDQLIFLKDVTVLTELERVNRNNAIVLGLAHLDNYEEITQYEEEQTIALIDANIRQEVVRWADTHNMYVRRIRQDRYLLVLNEQIFETISEDRFSILNDIRKASANIHASITLSLAFARKSENLKELEDMSNSALELAQARGGDQVAINHKESGMSYFGGASEAVEKRSKVRVRVMAENLGDIISKSKDVIILGHKMMDFDCFGSALGVGAIAEAYGKKTYIVMDEKDTEINLLDAFFDKREVFEEHHNFISKEDAFKLISDKSLLIMVDHHSLEQTQSVELVGVAKRIAVIDHHRRTGDFKFKPILTYIESSASSASELIVELYPYHRNKVLISKDVATFMYTGMLIDTNRFRHRSGSRTFEAAAELRKFGADISEVENMLRDDYVDFEIKNKILATSKLYDNYYVIAAYKHEPLSRTMLSQAADEILSVREVEASFVVAYINDDTVAISSRSKGELNVQIVMERLGGGGHFTGAATVIHDQSIQEIVERLVKVVDDVRKETEV
ncbi:DHH family phosphoesterase [Erysipelothrix sp. HDW6A]|uniref:DHH family phosphoesterase n=1 Tax=Erysipelothrix sp. HDW6A TaxID=2714928 RepID=UPI00140B3CDE|nr:DHH family phosphoesterase [Erysipelothrix sp. HDW6A]QIK56468.1 DHH family phosphoesterase [Erysipelothrix sp. HDW6A]